MKEDDKNKYQFDTILISALILGFIAILSWLYITSDGYKLQVYGKDLPGFTSINGTK